MQITIKQTGVPEIDRQHSQLVDLLSELLKYSGSRYDFSAALTAMAGLAQYTREHFEYEEALMAQWGFPDLDEHRAIHAELAAKVDGMWSAIETGEEVVTGPLVELLQTWIVQHINEEDVRYKALVLTG